MAHPKSPPPEEPSTENNHFLELDFVWTTLASRLIGDPCHDHKVIRSFSEAFQIPVAAVIAKIRMHFRPGNGTMH
jgi:hypothetical protein